MTDAGAAALRILIVAEHASARFGGEAALPLHYFRVLRTMGHAVWLITHARTRAELEALYPGDSAIHYIEDTGFHRLMWRLSRFLPAAIAYLTTGFASRLAVQREQRKVARRLVAAHGIAVVHQPMPVSPREPSLLRELGAPLVIGPMNGGMEYPPGFRQRKHVERIAVRVARRGSDLLNRLIRGKREAAFLLVANDRTRRALPTGARGSVIELVENGVDLQVWQPGDSGDAPQGPTNHTSFVFMGRLVDWKRVDLLLRAFERASRQAPMRLTIIGSGVDEAELRALADALGVTAAGRSSDGVHFAGWLPQRECADVLRASDCLVLPSVLECGGAVVLEAMAMGKPVIATAWGGPLDYLDASCGLLVEPTDPAALVAGLADAMVRLARLPDERERLGRGGRARILQLFDWNVKAARMCDIYRAAIAGDGQHVKPQMSV